LNLFGLFGFSLFGFGVRGLEIGVWRLEIGALDSRFWVWGSGFRV